MKNLKVLAFTSAQKSRAEIEKQFSVLASVFCATEWLRMILKNIQSKTFTNYDVDCSFFPFVWLFTFSFIRFCRQIPGVFKAKGGPSYQTSNFIHCFISKEKCKS